jgi:hypothetical protein
MAVILCQRAECKHANRLVVLKKRGLDHLRGIQGRKILLILSQVVTGAWVGNMRENLSTARVSVARMATCCRQLNDLRKRMRPTPRVLINLMHECALPRVDLCDTVQ